MQKLTIISTVKDGRLTKQNSLDVAKYLSNLNGKRVEITIQKLRSKRSNQQNRFYHGVVIPIAQDAFRELGYIMTKEETHEWIKSKFIEPKPMANKDGEFIGNFRPTTTDMTKTEFMDYIQQIQIWFAQTLGVTIPDPGQQTELF